MRRKSAEPFGYRRIRFTAFVCFPLYFACIIGSYNEDADTLHVGFLSTNESVRQQLLKITPAGTPFRTALTFTEKEAREHEPSILPLVQTQPVYRYHFANRRGEVDSIGVKRLGFEASYRVHFGLTSYSVKAEYGFDESDRLADHHKDHPNNR